MVPDLSPFKISGFLQNEMNYQKYFIIQLCYPFASAPEFVLDFAKSLGKSFSKNNACPSGAICVVLWVSCCVGQCYDMKHNEPFAILIWFLIWFSWCYEEEWLSDCNPKALHVILFQTIFPLMWYFHNCVGGQRLLGYQAYVKRRQTL